MFFLVLGASYSGGCVYNISIVVNGYENQSYSIAYYKDGTGSRIIPINFYITYLTGSLSAGTYLVEVYWKSYIGINPDHALALNYVGGQFFENPDWDKLVVSDNEAKTRLKQIKPQPDPAVRKRIWLNEWNCIGYKAGQHEEDIVSLQKWNNYDGLSVLDETLVFEKKAEITIDIPEQDWRSLFEVDVFIPEKAAFEWTIGDAVKITQKDILIGKGVIDRDDKQSGGLAAILGV